MNPQSLKIVELPETDFKQLFVIQLFRNYKLNLNISARNFKF